MLDYNPKWLFFIIFCYLGMTIIGITAQGAVANTDPFRNFGFNYDTLNSFINPFANTSWLTDAGGGWFILFTIFMALKFSFGILITYQIIITARKMLPF